VAGGTRIEHRADVVVGRDLVHRKQRLAVRAAAPALKRALLGQERRALHEERRERRHADVAHRIDAVVASPPVRQGRAQSPEARDERFERHAKRESATASQVDDSNRHTPPPRLPKTLALVTCKR